MKTFTIPNGSQLRVVKTTPRQEKHGKDDIQAITLRLEWWWPDNVALNMLHPGLQDSVFFVPAEEVAQEKIAGLVPVKKHLRVPGMWPQKAPMVDFSGYTLELEHGINDATALALYECKLDKFEVDAKEGGGGCVRFNAGSNQQITPELVGLLCSKERKEVKLIKLTPPQVRTDAIDGSTKAFKKDHPLLDQIDAADILAANEAAGKNKPAAEVPAKKPRAKSAKQLATAH